MGGRLNIQYETQEANGIAEAFLIGEKFIDNEDVTLCLGDNLFHGILPFQEAWNINARFNSLTSRIFAYQVEDPQRYGIVEFDKESGAVLSIEENQSPPNQTAVPGLYIYDNTVVEKAKALKPSPRGELEITDLNNLYLKEKNLVLKSLVEGLLGLIQGHLKPFI